MTSHHTDHTPTDPELPNAAHDGAPADVRGAFSVPIDEDPPPPPDGGPAPAPLPPPPVPPATRTVTGQVRDQFGVPVAGVAVKAFAERLRTTRAQLGAAVQTGSGAAAGKYTITFASPAPGFALVVDA